MPIFIKSLFKWSLQITGLSILCYQYQPIANKHKIQAYFNFINNSFHLLKTMYQIHADLKSFKTANFTTQYTQKIVDLCKTNGGIYAKLAQIISSSNQIIPNDHMQILQRINNQKPKEIPYSTIKETISYIFQTQIKEIFEGIHIKPLSCGWLTQTHKVTIAESFNDAVIKIILPTHLIQYQYQMKFLNKLKPHILQFLKQRGFLQDTLNKYVELIENAEKNINQNLGLQRQVENANMLTQLSKEANSRLYIPYYYHKLCNKYATTRQYIQGTSILNKNGLKELGISPQKAYAFLFFQIQRLIEKYHIINEINPQNLLIRKYMKTLIIKDVKSPSNQIEKNSIIQSKHKHNLPQPPVYQIVFLNMNNFAQVQQIAKKRFTNFYNAYKKQKIKFSVSDFRGFSLGKSNNRQNYMSQKLYLFEPLIRIYEKLELKK